MDTYLAYFDETGDDGVTIASSEFFVLTSFYMSATKALLTDKNPYRNYGRTQEQKQKIPIAVTKYIGDLEMIIINAIIDKTRFRDENCHVLENALTYNIQRIENDSKGQWNYIIITDQGWLTPIKKTARAIRAYNPIQFRYNFDCTNQPISNMTEDIPAKDSKRGKAFNCKRSTMG